MYTSATSPDTIDLFERINIDLDTSANTSKYHSLSCSKYHGEFTFESKRDGGLAILD